MKRENWLRKKLYNEDVWWDAIHLGRFTVHLCGPWDFGAPLRLHFNWANRNPKQKGWHFAIGKFAKRVHEGEGSRWYYVGSPRLEEKHKRRYQEWRGEE